jgi:hypothetical protein
LDAYNPEVDYESRHRASFCLAAILALAWVLRTAPFSLGPEPTGGDWGHHSRFADDYLSEGRLPRVHRFFQVGVTRFPVLPGGAVAFALFGAGAGGPSTLAVPVLPLLGAIEGAGVFLLARRVLGGSVPALFAAGFVAVYPASPEMAGWGGYPNLIALALVPYVLLAAVEYWEEPGLRSAALLILGLGGTAVVHHLTTLWLGLSLAGGALAMLLLQGRPAARRLAVVLPGLAVLALPVWLEAQALWVRAGREALLQGGPRFADTRIDWDTWMRLVGPASLLVLGAGGWLFLRSSRVPAAARVALVAWVLVTLGLGFAWPGFVSYRALYFLGVPSALGAAALVARDSLRPRPIEALLTIGLGVGALALGRHAAARADALQPGVLAGLAFVRSVSSPSDIVVIGPYLGFHAGRLLERPLLVAMEPHNVGNWEELPYASLATGVLRGTPGALDEAARRGARFIVVLNRDWEWPDPKQTQAALRAQPRLRRVFDNDALTVYQVRPLGESSRGD